MMGKPTQTTKERATGNYIRPASPLPNAQQHAGERRRQTGTQEGKREQQDERGAPAARRDVDVEAGGALRPQCAHGRTLCKPRMASHLAAAVFAVRVDPAHSAVAAKHSGRCPKRTALAPRRRPAPRELCGWGIPSGQYPLDDRRPA